jgi:hypothetical protein
MADECGSTGMPSAPLVLPLGTGGGWRALCEDGQLWLRLLEVAEIQTEVRWFDGSWGPGEVEVLKQLLYGLVERAITNCFRRPEEFVEYYSWGGEYLAEHPELVACFAGPASA